ncbi:MAG: endonuclease MutS2 [Clostridia bacterium]|nr:endonuclease MutS2 [Clostridia bacterium]
MIDNKTLKSLEYDKVLTLISSYAVLKRTKTAILETKPLLDLNEILLELDKTEEAYKLLFDYGVSSVEFFDDITDELSRAKKGSTLNLAELLRVARLLKSSRIVRNGILAITDEKITKIPEICERLYCDQYLEKEITSKILSDEKVSDNASEKLSSLRKKIKKLNEQIRERLNWYIRSGEKYLQENIVTIRNDRYVVPVKSEHRSQVKGFVHDQSATGSTVFIEPVEILEFNNQLRIAQTEEALEIQAILQDLSHKVSLISNSLEYNLENICEIDTLEAKATYAYKTRAKKPFMTNGKTLEIINGRHPLIDAKEVVPLTVKLGNGYNYLLITGPNTGGKTVTLKLTGLFSVMAQSGMFLPATEGTTLPVYQKIFCDIGDEQSIEQSLSTFSSHVKNLVKITENADSDSLCLIDEIGAGTDPDEGSALAQAVIEHLLDLSSYGIITTHYSKLKEFAFIEKRIKNASMDFNPETFQPLYKLNIGTPGSSNAIEIAKRLGVSHKITKKANSHLSSEKVSFENVLKEAESARQQSLLELEKNRLITEKIESEYKEVAKRNEELKKEKERLLTSAKSESRRIISEKAEEAEELIEEIKEILKKDEITSGDLIRARTLKNKLEDKKYSLEPEEETPENITPVIPEKLFIGKSVYVKSLSSIGNVVSINLKRKQVVVLVGGIKFTVKPDVLFDYKMKEQRKENKPTVKIKREISSDFKTEINVLGLDRNEAIIEVENFIDQAVVHNAVNITIVHGVGMKVLSTAIHAYLKKNKFVKEFRFGRYGEGENGVTVVTLK